VYQHSTPGVNAPLSASFVRVAILDFLRYKLRLVHIDARGLSVDVLSSLVRVHCAAIRNKYTSVPEAAVLKTQLKQALHTISGLQHVYLQDRHKHAFALRTDACHLK
jgi:hypothetical protein